MSDYCDGCGHEAAEHTEGSGPCNLCGCTTMSRNDLTKTWKSRQAAAQPEPRTPDETLAAKVREIADGVVVDLEQHVTLMEAAKRLRELAADARRLDWHAAQHGMSPPAFREAIDQGIAEQERRAARQQLAQGGGE